MLRIAAVVLGAWFAVGLAVALLVGRASRLAGSTSAAPLQPSQPAPVAGLVTDELAVRRARRTSIGVRVAAAAAAIGVVGAVSSVQGVASFDQTPAANVKAPVVVDDDEGEPEQSSSSPTPPRRSAAIVERFDDAEHPSQPGHAHAQDAPGHDPAGPGRSEEALGHDPAGPGRSEQAPGRELPDRPGRSEDAPGRTEDGPARSNDAPGRSGH